MKHYIIALALGSLFIASPVFAAPTCSLTVNTTPIQLMQRTPVHLVWSATGGTTATLKVNAWSQPNIYSTTGLTGNVTVPILASMGLTATLTVNNAGGASTVCAKQLPVFWIPKK